MPPSAEGAGLPALTPLQWRVARGIVDHIRHSGGQAGDRLAESVLAAQLGTSRSPVNVALRHLASQGLLAHDLHRGYFLARGADALDAVARGFAAVPEDPLYAAIAADRLDRRLGDSVSEMELVRLYGSTRGAVRTVLSRIQQEGWIEKSAGQGWVFQPLIDSPEAYEESFAFRLLVEPAGLLTATFQADVAQLAALRAQQRLIADGGYRSMTAAELYDANRAFHGALAQWSGNRFLQQTVRRIDHLRRLVEYRQAQDRAPRHTAALEHLAVLDAIAAGDLPRAAGLLREHLERARGDKVQAAASPPARPARPAAKPARAKRKAR